MTRDADDTIASADDDLWEGFIDPSTGLPYEPHEDDTTAVTTEERRHLDIDEFWDARPILRHLHTFARARRVGPWAVLGATMCRVVSQVSPEIQLPPTIGGFASLNLFVGLVGESGDGKDAAQKVAAAALYLEHPKFNVAPLGSGEGLSHMFMRQRRATKDDPYPEPEQYNRSALVTIGEIDSMAALVQRQSSTVTSQLRQAAMGEQLGFFYADASRRMIVPEHSYRLCLLAGIQPRRSAILLSDEAGGTPQRFVWLPSGDPGARREVPVCPTPMVWQEPGWPYAERMHENGQVRFVVTEPPVVRDAIIDARVARQTHKGEALDSHAVLTRVKVAAAFAIMDGRVAITDEDWDLSGVVMHVSDTQRGMCQRVLQREAEKSQIAKALADADRTLVVEEHIDRTKVAKCAEAARRVMARVDGEGWISGADLRRKLRQGHREFLDPALDALTISGDVEAEKTGNRGPQGMRYRITR